MLFVNHQQIGFIRASQKSEFKGLATFSEYKQSITLFSKQYNYNIFDFMPKLFTISTNTGSSKFNVYILTSTSSVIADFLSKNPDQTKYHLDINDKEHVLEKFEKLYQGEFVIFEEDDLPVCHKITKLLNIINCPNFLKPESLKSNQNFGYVYNRNDNNCLGSEIDYNLLKNYLQSESSREFKIITNKKEYKCSVFGVYSSSVIRKLLLQDPTIKSYVYNYEDEFEEFQNICDLFNFQTVNLTRNKMDSIRRIAEDLQINLIIKDIDNYINTSEKVSQQIDEQQAIIDFVDEIFDLLYKIKEKTVEVVKQNIIESKWSKTTDNVKELAAFIIQVIEADFQLHEYIIDLLIQLDQVGENESLKILMNIIIKKLTTIAFPKVYQNESSNSSVDEEQCPITVYGFIYKLYKKKIISKEKLYHKLSLTSFETPNLKIWFYPELKEINPNFMNEPSKLVDNKDSKIFDEIIQNVFEKNIDDYKKMRDDYQPLDKITIALRNDDVRTVQLILSKIDFFKQFKKTIPFNIFENYVQNGSTNYINYAAAYGSVKCFKYLFLNHFKPDIKTFSHAIYGGNTEIIKIVDQYEKENFNNKQRVSEKIYPAILKHRNDISDWFFEQNLINEPPDGTEFNILFNYSVECGNLHSLIELIDKGFDFTRIDIFENTIIQSCQKGFYSILHLIFNFKNDHIFDFDRFDPSCLISFDNVSIFKLFENKMSPNVLENLLFIAVEMNCTGIIKYYFESIFNRLLRLTPCCASELLNLSVNKKKNDSFYYILNNIKKIDSLILSDNFDFDQTLTLACIYGKIEITKTITELITEKSGPEIDFTSFFIEAASSDSIDICKYFIDKKLKINFEAIADHVPDLGWMNEEIFDIIIKNVSDESKGKIINCIDIAIKKKNKNLLNYLLKETILPYNSLFLAVQTSDVEIVDIILKVNSKPSFINQIGNNGTALFIAAKNGDIEIVKKLLSIKGIDPNLYYIDNTTPLIAAFNENHFDVVNLIIDFYGNDKENLKWQLNIVISKIIDFEKKPTLNYDNQQETIEEINAQKIYKNLLLCRILDTMSIDPNYHFKRNNLLAYACINNNIELVQKLLKYNNIDVNKYDPNLGETPLMIAIKNNNIEIVDLLINHPKIDINKRSYDNKSALIYAVSFNFKKIICHILNNEKFDPVESRLDYAFYISSEEISQQLISVKTLDVNYCYQSLDDKPVKICNSIKDDLKQSKLKKKSFSKAKEKMKKMANKYLKFGMNDENIIGSDHKAKTSLINAFGHNDINKIKLIINHPSFDKIKSQLKTAIILSVKTGNVEVFRVLSKLDDESPNIIDTSNNSLLYNSISNGYTEIYEEILNDPKFDSKKSDILKCFVMSYTSSAKINNNNNEKAVSPIPIMNRLVDYDKKNDHLIDFKKLLPCGKSFFTYGLTPFRYGDKICNFLLENGCDPNEPDKDGIYPLQYAICEGLYNFVRSLINSEKINLTKLIPYKNSLFYKFDKTANYPNRNMPKNTTYLHLAAGISNYDIFKLFLNANGIDVNVKDDIGETPLMIACRCKNVEVIGLLEKINNLDYLHCNNNGDDAAKIISNDNTTQIKEKADYFNFLVSNITDKDAKKGSKLKLPTRSNFNRNHIAKTSRITIGKLAPKNKSGLSLANTIKITNKKNIFPYNLDKVKTKAETTPSNKKTADNSTVKSPSANKNSSPEKVLNTLSVLDANINSNKQNSANSQIKSSSVNQKSHYGKFSFDFKKINDKNDSNKQIDKNNLKDNSSIVSKFQNKTESNIDDKPKSSQNENSICGIFQRKVEEAIAPVFKDADEKQVRCLSKIALQENSKNKSLLLNQDCIDQYNEIDDDDDDDDKYYDSLYYQQSPSFNQNLLMMMQQQQQQWFQMIQMNNARQAQINLQMMNQNLMMLQKSKKKKKKSHK